MEVGDQIGRYVLEAPLGAGGLGEVWKARLTGPMGFQRSVAVKVIRLDQDDDEARAKHLGAQLVDEARLCGRLHHPNVVPFTDFGQEDGHFFAVMELVAGLNLREVIERSTDRGITIPTEVALSIAHQVARGLGYAHRLTDEDGKPLRVVHRDLKPENVMVSPEGAVRLLDFGIARSLSNLQRTCTGEAVIRGTPGYLTPDQVDVDKTIDGRTDLFALGLVLFELLVGRRLYRSTDLYGLLWEVARADFGRDLVELQCRAPEAVPLVTALLARDQEARPVSAVEVERRLEQLLGGRGGTSSIERFVALLKGAPPDRYETEHSLDPSGVPRFPPTLGVEPPVPVQPAPSEPRREPPPPVPAPLPSPGPSLSDRPRRRRRRLPFAWLLGLVALALVAIGVTVVLPARTGADRRPVVLGVELDGVDEDLARWTLERRLTDVASEVLAVDGGGEGLVLDGVVEPGGAVRWLGARRAGGALTDIARSAALDAARSTGADVAALPWTGGFTARLGFAEAGDSGFVDITSLRSLDGAPLPPLSDWPEDARRALARAVFGCAPPAVQQGPYVLRADVELDGTSGGEWLARGRSIRPEVFSTRMGLWLRSFEQLSSFDACLQQVPLPSVPEVLTGRRVLAGLLATGNSPTPPPRFPDNPSRLEDLEVRPPRLRLAASDVRVIYTSAAPQTAVDVARILEEVIPSIERCDEGLLLASGVLQEDRRAVLALDASGPRLTVDPDADAFILSGGVGGEAGLQADLQAPARKAVFDCVEATLGGVDWPEVDRLVLAELRFKLGPPPPLLPTERPVDVELATRAVTAALASRYMEVAACRQQLADAGAGADAELPRGWYAEVAADGSLERFAPHWRAPPTGDMAACMHWMREGLMLPETGRRVVVDPQGLGLPEEDLAALVTEADFEAAGTVSNLISPHLGSMRRCWEREMERAPDLSAARMELYFSILTTGRFSDIRISTDGGEMPGFADCIAEVLVPVRATVDPRGGEITVAGYPIRFSRSD